METEIRLPYRPPFDWPALLAFLAPRAIPGVERVTADEYRRTVDVGGAHGVLRVRAADDGDALLIAIPPALRGAREAIATRVRRQFDLDADAPQMNAHLARDPLLAPLVERWPGTRVPGAWEPFELGVRAVVGQQVSVAAATTIAGRIAARYGTRIASGDDSLDLLFPAAARLARARVGGMPATRAATIRNLANAAGFASIDDLLAVPGIGPWTANYIAMRALRDPDAFPHGDLGLRHAARGLTDRELSKRAEAWRPWRAYAAMLLWRSL